MTDIGPLAAWERPEADRLVPTVKAGHLLVALKAVKHAAASTEDNKPILATVVFVADGPSTIRVVAADNYRIATCRIPAEGAVADLADIILSILDVPSVIAFLASLPEDGDVYLRRSGQTLALDYSPSHSLSVALVDGSYPDVRVVMEPAERGASRLAFNPLFLKEAGAAALSGKFDPVIVMRFGESLSAVSFGCGAYRETIMPVRLGEP